MSSGMIMVTEPFYTDSESEEVRIPPELESGTETDDSVDTDSLPPDPGPPEPLEVVLDLDRLDAIRAITEDYRVPVDTEDRRHRGGLALFTVVNIVVTVLVESHQISSTGEWHLGWEVVLGCLWTVWSFLVLCYGCGRVLAPDSGPGGPDPESAENLEVSVGPLAWS